MTKKGEVWLFPQNACSVEQFFTTLEMFYKFNGVNKNLNIQQILMEKQKEKGLYNPYIKKDYYDLSSANHKIDEPRFYGAIYETPNKKIHLSSYGELLLKYKDDEIKRNKIFIAMLYNIQFNNPYKNFNNFEIYPIRLIFELLRDKRLKYKLSNIEIAYILYNVNKIKCKEDYDNIVRDIINFRKNMLESKIELLKEDSTQFIINYVSCNYFINILRNMNIISIDIRDSFKLKSSRRKNFTTITNRVIEIDKEYIKFIDNLRTDKTIYEAIKKMKGLKSDWIREIYNDVSPVLINELDDNNQYLKFLMLPKMLIETSVKSEKWSLFEDCLNEVFNLFEDVRSEKISGAGEPDLLCVYMGVNNIKFTVDAKSTKKKLSYINDGRLKQHREKYSAIYTLVVTPEYVPSALKDIKNTDSCIITSYCFADLINKYIFKNEKSSYEIFNDLILNNLGTDLSDKIYSIIDYKMGF